MDDLNKVGLFDRIASVVAEHTSRAWFFTACVLLVVIWIPSIFLLNINTSQLLINTATTIITFLLVALLNNTQRRDVVAVHAKLDVIATAQRDTMAHLAHQACPYADCNFSSDIADLERAIGIESEVGTKVLKEMD